MEENQKPYIDIAIDYAKQGLKWFLIAIAVIVIADLFGDNYNLKWQSPLLIERRKTNIVTVSPVAPKEEVEETEEIGSIPATSGGDARMWAGNASWYGARDEWCVGCNPNFIMANGQKLDDSKKTLAFNQLPLGTWVTVTNVDTGLREEAEITDTGGFNDLGRIADLSVALRNALGCGDICTVTVETY